MPNQIEIQSPHEPYSDPQSNIHTSAYTDQHNSHQQHQNLKFGHRLSVWESDPGFFYVAASLYVMILASKQAIRTFKNFSVLDFSVTNYKICQEGHLFCLCLCRFLYVIAGLSFGNSFYSLFLAFICRCVSFRSWVLLVCQTRCVQALAEGRNQISIPVVWKVTTIYFVFLLGLAYAAVLYLQQNQSVFYHKVAIITSTHITTVILLVISFFVLLHAFWCLGNTLPSRFMGYICGLWGNVGIFLAGVNSMSIHDPTAFFGSFRIFQGLFLLGEVVLIVCSMLYESERTTWFEMVVDEAHEPFQIPPMSPESKKQFERRLVARAA